MVEKNHTNYAIISMIMMKEYDKLSSVCSFPLIIIIILITVRTSYENHVLKLCTSCMENEQ